MSQIDSSTDEHAPAADTRVVMITVARLASYRSIPAFNVYALATVIGSLAAPGNIGARFRIRTPMAYYTMSAWEDEEAMMGFLRRPAHRAAMRASKKLVGQHVSARVEINESLKELTWRDAYAHIDAAALEPKRSTSAVS